MKCDEFRELLSLYIDHMLDDSQMKEMEEHLASCAACKNEYNELNEMILLLNQTEMVPVPDSFEFRMKKALKEEKEKMAIPAVSDKTAKKGKWRMITSIAAIFAVGVISLSVYNNVLGVISDKLNGNDQSGVHNKEIAAVTNSAVTDNSEALKADDFMAKDQVSTSALTIENAGNESLKSAQDNDAESRNMKSAASGNAAGDEENTPLQTYGIIDGSADSGSGDSARSVDAGIAAESSGLPSMVGGSEYDTGASLKTAPTPNCSRSLTSSGVERNTAAVQYYESLIEKKLEGFDYQILDSGYAQSGEWQFRVFIFRGKDGNTYNEEILITGKNGEIKVLYSNEFMGLQK